MKKDLRNINIEDYKYVIAGSGPAGLFLAYELKEKTKEKILILEAGSFDYEESSQEFYKGKVLNNCNLKKLHSSRIRAFGGTTMVWGGMCRPLDEIDFAGWPIKKKDLDPYLVKANKLLNLKRDFSRDLNLNENLKLIDFQWNEPTLRLNESYKEKILKDKRVDIVIKASVIRIEGTNKINFVELYNNKFNEYIKITPKIFILACGSVENSRILLLSKLKSKENFMKNINIGEYYLLHPHYVVAKSLTNMKKFKKILNKNYMNKGMFFLSPTKELIEKLDIGNTGLRIQVNRYPSDTKEFIKDLLCVAPKYAEKIISLIDKKIDCANLKFFSSWESKPNKKNKITLDYENLDLHNNPRVKLIANLSNEEKRTIKLFLEHLGTYFLDEDLGIMAIREFLYNYEKNWPEDGYGGSHEMGGARMGENPNLSVVDGNLKVHNINNLYLSGSSVFPSAGHANPTFTICQLSLRLANHLANLNI